MNREIDILLVEDDPDDVLLTREALKGGPITVKLTVVEDGERALAYLRRQAPYDAATLPHMILMDLNMPRMDGRELLRELKADQSLKAIPAIILTCSDAAPDIVKSYDLGANCFITKPMGLDDFRKAMRIMEEFWFEVASIPQK